MINLVLGLLLAWVLVRYEFPGKRLFDAVIDLPFALPTAVAGVALTALYAGNGWIGQLVEPLGIKLAYSQAGITLALMFIGIPFVVRTVQPVLEELEAEVEEAAATLGAGRWRIFRTILLPDLIPPLLTGFALAFARGIGEYGSVVFISGNMPMKTEIAPADHGEAGAVRLRRSYGCSLAAAAGFFCPAAGNQLPSALEQEGRPGLGVISQP